MTAKYYVTLTDYGATQVAQAHDVASITLAQMVIGDANGIPYDPIDQKSRTSLVNQRATVPVQAVTIEGAVTTVTATVAANIGGFNLLEIGLKDSTGQLVYIGNYHGGYKPAIAEGAGGELTIVIDITAESGKEALIEIDPNVVTANKSWVMTQINPLKDRVLNIETFIENIVDYFLPVDTIISSFDPDFDPNIKYVGTTWVLHGQGKAAVGLSKQTFDPEWTKTIGTKFGEFDHQLTTDELPNFSLNYPNQWAGTNPPNVVEVYSYDDIGWAKDGAADTALLQHTNSVGADQPHNNVQPSIVEARWRRTA